jgi:thioredoxin 1
MSHDPDSHVHAEMVTGASFPFEVLRADRPVLVDFYADWCGACQQLAPVLDDLAGDYDGRVKVVKVDVERHAATAERLDIRGIPTLVLFTSGEERWRLVNVTRKAAITAELDAALDPSRAAP